MPHRQVLFAAAIAGALVSGCAQSPYATEMSLAPPPLPKTVLPAGPWQTTTAMIPTAGIGTIASPNAAQAATTPPTTPVAYTPSRPVAGRHHELSGLASYYWQDQMTASGERFNKNAMTAAHKTLPLGTHVRVTHATSGRSVVVRINDRGPFKPRPRHRPLGGRRQTVADNLGRPRQSDRRGGALGIATTPRPQKFHAWLKACCSLFRSSTFRTAF